MLALIFNALTDVPSPSLEKLSKKLGIHRKRIQLLVKTSTGRHFREVREICRLCQSVKQLASGHSIKETALECGYAWPGNYTRALKKYLGVSPSMILERQMYGGHIGADAFSCPLSVQ